MRIDIKSFILGVIVGGCTIIYRASVQVARDKNAELEVLKKTKEEA